MTLYIGGTMATQENRLIVIASAFWIGQIQASIEDTREMLTKGLQGTASFGIFANDPNQDIRIIVIVSRQLSEDTLKSIFRKQMKRDLMYWKGSNETSQTQTLRKQTEKVSSRKLRSIGGCLRRYCFFVDFFKKNTDCVQLNSHEFNTLMSAALKSKKTSMIEELITQIFGGMTLLKPAITKRVGSIEEKLLLIENHLGDMERIADQNNDEPQSILLYKRVIQNYVDKIHTSWAAIRDQLLSQENKSDFMTSDCRLEAYKTDAITIALLCALQTAIEKWEEAIHMTDWKMRPWILLDELLSTILKQQAIALDCTEQVMNHITKQQHV